jgi:hypothetical protein
MRTGRGCVPFCAGVLAVVGGIAGAQRELQRNSGRRGLREGIHRPDRGVGDLGGEHLVRSVGRLERDVRIRVRQAVEEFETCRGLGVLHMDVGELDERGQRAAGR